MRFNVARWSRFAVAGLVISTVFSTGCTSATGWKMPNPTKMFSWSKKPSETTIAGSGPSAMTAPMSPATKQTPSAIASTAAGNNKSATGANLASANRNASPVFNPSGAPSSFGGQNSTGNTQVNSMANVSFAPPGAAQNAAATANGYSVGPYNTYGQPNNAANQLASAGAVARPAGIPNGMAATGTASMNPYGTNAIPASQTYGGSTNSNLVANRSANPGMAFPPQGTMTTPAAFAAPPNSMPQAFAPSSAMSSNAAHNFGAPPTANGFASSTMPQMTPTTGGYTPVGTQNFAAAGIGAPPSGFNASAGGTPANFASAPNTSGSSVPAQMATYTMPSGAAAAPYAAASYRPGSTGRQTNYNFNQPTTGSVPPAANGLATSPSQGLPAPSADLSPSNSFGGPAANTANGTSNPGFQIPPAANYRR